MNALALTSPPNKLGNRLIGIAPACFASIFCALAIATHGISKTNTANPGIEFWSVFVIISGLFINPEDYAGLTDFQKLKSQIRFACIPTATLIVTWLLIPVLPIILGLNTIENCKPILVDLLVLLPLVAILTPPLIVISTYFRFTVFRIFQIPISDYKKWNEIIATIGLLIGTLISLLAWFM